MYLQREYLPEHNRRFRRAAARAEDYHRRAPRASELDRIFRLESERVVSEDGVVRYANRYFQLEGRVLPRRSQVQVYEGRHGKIAIEYRGQDLRWKEIAAPVKRAMREGHGEPQFAGAERKTKWVPPSNHPWREAVRRTLEKKAMREARVSRATLARPCAAP